MVRPAGGLEQRGLVIALEAINIQQSYWIDADLAQAEGLAHANFMAKFRCWPDRITEHSQLTFAEVVKIDVKVE